jgi:hypothetical protein
MIARQDLGDIIDERSLNDAGHVTDDTCRRGIAVTAFGVMCALIIIVLVVLWSRDHRRRSLPHSPHYM